MRLLKISVIAMGVLIIAGLTVVLFTVADRWGGGKTRSAATTPSHIAVPSPIAIDTAITLPAGAEIVETKTAPGRIILRLRMADGTAALLLIDSNTGKQAGLIRLR